MERKNKMQKETLPELSLLDHLNELRQRIIHCLIFFIVLKLSIYFNRIEGES